MAYCADPDVLARLGRANFAHSPLATAIENGSNVDRIFYSKSSGNSIGSQLSFSSLLGSPNRTNKKTRLLDQIIRSIRGG